MSAKWRENMAWEDATLVGPWRPLKWVLRAFSSITLAVVLLVLVALFGVSASVPIGLLALVPTYLFITLLALILAALCAGLPAWLALRLTHRRSPGVRLAAGAATLLAGLAVAVFAWRLFAWPHLRYDPLTDHGLRFFSDFVDRYKGITLRRLPFMEMTEVEYYAWWPLRVVLLLFVLNMVVATVRRVEFSVRNIGVLAVHAGIVILALGSVYYSGLKVEGDTILLAGAPGPDGRPTPGPEQTRFFDATSVALYVDQGRGFEQRRLSHVPRYNDYALDAFEGDSARQTASLALPWTKDPGPRLHLPVPPSRYGLVDDDISLDIVGYASYAEPVADYVRENEPQRVGFQQSGPLRIVHLYSRQQRSAEPQTPEQAAKPAFAFMLAPALPAKRIAGNTEFALEYTLGAASGMSDDRWRALTAELPPGTLHALVLEVPATGGRLVRPVKAGDSVDLDGYHVEVRQLLPQPPFPIITEGYRDATSATAVLRISPPAGPAYDRYVYDRFPEINQDVLGAKEDGRPIRRDADPAIRISLVEADRLLVNIDEPSPSLTRAVVRLPGGERRVYEPQDLGPDARLRDIVDHVDLAVAQRWDHAAPVERPAPVPESQREKDAIGTHEHAMLAVRLSTPAREDRPAFARVVWLPFNRYVGVLDGAERTVTLPDGREVTLCFGRSQHAFPDFSLSLVDFQMIAYDHRGSPRDYQSVIRVTPADRAAFTQFNHVCKLNNPLRAPFHWDDARPLPANIARKLAAGLSPTQFKMSQAGWDAAGWDRTQKQADAGLIARPFASFTILGVGNNPGIHVIALGGILMGLGIPWAFYLKPYLVRRQKARLQRAVREGAIVPPGPSRPLEIAP